jgi:hypothetical protein
MREPCDYLWFEKGGCGAASVFVVVVVAVLAEVLDTPAACGWVRCCRKGRVVKLVQGRAVNDPA